MTAPPAPRTHLPLELSTFVDRERELAEVTALLQRARLLTLTGPPGVGKTRLAVEAARLSQDTFTDGVHFADFAGVTATDQLPRVIAAALGLPPGPVSVSPEALAAALADANLLLVLDTCEHVRHACAEVVFVLLSRCPQVQVLATSRRPLDLTGETVWRVAHLEAPQSGLAWDAVASKPAARMFVDRAREADPHFDLSESEANQVAELSRRLEGLPLALELAASRMRVLGVSEIVERLDQPLGLLTTPTPVSPERHRSMRAALDWSLALLSDRERRVFRRLGVFSGSWDLQAAGALCMEEGAPESEVAGAVVELVAASLVQVVPEGEAFGSRYRLFELVRHYALEQLERAGEAGRIRALHAAWYGDVARRVELGQSDPTQVRRLQLEQANLSSALAWAVEAQDTDLAVLLLVRLHGLWYLQGAFAESRRWFARAMAMDGGSIRSKAVLASLTSTQATAAGDLESARRFASAAAAAAIDVGDVASGVQAMDALAEIYLTQGQLEAAERTLRQELELLASMPGVDWLRWLVLVNLARMELERGSSAAAAQLAHEAIAGLGEQADVWTRLRAIRVLGQVAMEAGDLTAAADHFDTGLDWARALNDRQGMTILLIELTLLARLRNDLTTARSLLREAVPVAQQSGHPLSLIRVLESVASLYAQARPLAALRLRAAASLRRTRLGLFAWPREQVALERSMLAATSRLRMADVTRAVTAGEQLGDAEAVEAALALLAAGQAGRPVAAAQGAGLTRRELEVARLLGQGLANAQIADALLVSQGTVRAHVERILSKLGLRSRAEIGDWLAQQGPE